MKISVALLGCGMMGCEHLSYMSSFDEININYLCDPNKKILHKFSVELPKKHSKGGQSAQRFGRIRLEKRHQYLKKCAELTTQHFIKDNICNVKGLVLAGSV